jgi:ABC-type transport system involved in multi-copper enzyme maturation permease subunit
VRDVWDNPVARKELRGRMRTGRTFVTLSVYVVSLSVFLLGFYAILLDTLNFSATTYNVEDIGGTLFAVVVGMEMLLTSLIAPTLTAGAISGERERQTYDLLRVTLLSARRLVMGKLAAALAYVVLLLVVAVPLQSVAFFFGGISAADVWLSLWVMLVNALFLAALGLYFSARTWRTFSAKALTYAVVVGVAFGLPFLGGMMLVDWSTSGYQTSTPTTFYVGGAPLATSQMPSLLRLYAAGALLSFNPALALLMTHAAQTQSHALLTFSYTPTGGQAVTLPSPWVVFSGLYLGLTVLLLKLAIRRVRRVER